MPKKTQTAPSHRAPAGVLDRREALLQGALAVSWAAAAGAGLLPRAAAAQTGYPDRAVKLVVPFPPGGLLDSVARTIAPRLSAQLGQPMVVDNRAGSGGNLGADAVAKAAPDGLTTLLGSPGLTISPHLYAKLPYALDDLAPVALWGSLPNVLLVHKDLPVRNVAELIALLRASPGRTQYASNGNGTSLHLSAELFKFRTRTFVLHVPYRGSAPAMLALQGGEVQMMFDNLPPALGHIQAGRVRALAVTSAKRSPALPDVPTLQEAGLADFDVTAWFGLMAPRATPEAVLRRLEQESAKAIADAEVSQALRKLGIEPGFQGSEPFARHLKRELAQWRDVVAYARIKID